MKKLFYTLVLVLILNSVLLVQNSSAQWVKIGNELPFSQQVFDLCAVGTNIFAATPTGVWRSTNNGSNWTQTSLNTVLVLSLTTYGNNIYAGTDFQGMYRSTNNGINWSLFGNLNYSILTLITIGDYIYAGTTNYGVFQTLYSSGTWVNSLSVYGATVRAITTAGTTIFAGTYQYPNPGLIYRSTNNGSSWIPSVLDSHNCAVNSMATIGNTVYAGSDSNLYISTNFGISWSRANLYNRTVNSLATVGNNIIAGTSANQDSGIFRSTNNGTSWTPVNEGFGNLNGEVVFNFLVTSQYIFAGGNTTAWRRPLSEIIIGIKNISTEIPSAYSLSQNYPNPFNPTTKIRFGIPKASVGQTFLFVTIKVFDIMGREVQTLVNESLAPGTYETTFDGSNLSSGTYFYKLTTGDFSQTKKLTLLK